ncbi:MAG: nitrogenase iron-molybdenum cofactor biosynthesis protein NifN, partial [Pseudomonadota bacterium]
FFNHVGQMPRCHILGMHPFFVRHFREPIPLQTTAMDQVSTVMGADDNLIEGLKTICEKNAPEIIGVPTTGLSETQGTDIHRLVRSFRTLYPHFDHITVIPVNTPDYTGSLESGYALAVEAIIETLVKQSARAGQSVRQINVLASSMLTPGDLESLRDWIETFGLTPVILPDLGDSLDGHLTEAETTPLTLGGTPRSAIEAMGESIATLVIGRSLQRAADLLHERTQVPDWRFDHLMGLDACDALTQTLATLSERPVPDRIERHRAQLQDALLDTHFMTGFARVALALDPDLLLAFGEFLAGLGAEIVAAVATVRAPALADMPCAVVQVGDLEDLARMAQQAGAELLIANSHAARSATRLGIPLLRAGFPQYDLVGGYTRTWIGYRGTRQTLFDLANLILENHHDIPAYRSLYRNNGPSAPARLVSY